jgi:hypothetical protein
MDEIDSCLKDEPGRETRNNKKPSPNRVANRELRSDRSESSTTSMKQALG